MPRVDARAALETFLLDDLAGWYIPHGRRWFTYTATDPAVIHAKAYSYYVLQEVVAQADALSAELIPPAEGETQAASVDEFSSRGDGAASPIPPETAWRDPELEARVHTARTIVALARVARARTGLPAWQPLSQLFVAPPRAFVAETLALFAPLIAEEASVYSVWMVAEEELDRLRAVARASRDLDQTSPLFADDSRIALGINAEVTPELRSAGLAELFTRRVQDARESADYQMTDWIRIRCAGTADITAAVQSFADRICEKTRALSVEILPATSSGGRLCDFDGETVRIQIEKASNGGRTHTR
jgi:hypothetical protein